MLVDVVSHTMNSFKKWPRASFVWCCKKNAISLQMYLTIQIHKDVIIPGSLLASNFYRTKDVTLLEGMQV
jgi:hypothetical protein